MTLPRDPAHGLAPQVPAYSTGFRRALSVAAFVTSLLPAVVAILELLPTYRIQAKFLIFYGPLVCFLALSYLFYIRDALARAMFAGILRPTVEANPYYSETFRESLHSILRRVRSLILALLPIALLLTSSYCAIQYLRLVNESVSEASEQKRRTASVRPQEVGSLPAPSDSGSSKRLTRRGRKAAAELAPSETQSPAPVSPDRIRQDVLQSSGVDDIPAFNRLNIWYIGIFLCAEMAFILMALKEYAKEAMGLSERDMVLGPLGEH